MRTNRGGTSVNYTNRKNLILDDSKTKEHTVYADLEKDIEKIKKLEKVKDNIEKLKF